MKLAPVDRARAANVAAWRIHVTAAGGEIIEADGLFTGFTGASGASFNPTIATAASFSDALEAREKEYLARGKSFGFLVDERFAEEGKAAAERMGLYPNPPSPSMVLQPIIPDLEVRGRVRLVGNDAAGYEHHVLVQTAGFGSDEAEVRAFMPPSVLASEELLYLGYDEAGRPAATSVLVATPPDAGVFGVSTHPDRRRRGLGRAVTVAAVRDAVAAGCDLVYLSASAMGYPIYEALGFRTVEYLRTFVRERSQLEA